MSIGFNLQQDSHYAAEVLSEIGAHDIEGFLLGTLKGHIEGLPESAAKALYLDLDDILAGDNPEEELKRRTRALSHEDKALYAQYLIIRNTCISASPIIATGNASAEENPYDIDQMIGKMAEKDVTAEQLGKILGTITQWKTGTSHPTQHLSEEGKALFRDLLEIVNLPADQRVGRSQNTIKAMLDVKMTRDKRMNIREETNSDRAQAKLHRQAQRQTYRKVQAALIKHHPGNTPDLLDGDIRMTLPYHTWNGAGDADGKPNADKKALLEGMVGYTFDAIEEHLNDINRAIELDPTLATKLKNSKRSLETVFDRLKSLEQKLDDENDKTDFDALKTEYANLYKGLSIDCKKGAPVPVNCEKEMYEQLTQGLRHTIGQSTNEEAQWTLAESLFVMRQYKQTFTTAKIEKRANGLVDMDIMNKLFADPEFQNAFLDGPMRRNLANKAFTRLSNDEQRDMMRRVGKFANKTPEIVQEHYRRIFPEGPDKKNKGFPNQPRERGERLALQALSPDKFGMSIVAEAGEMSAEYAFFLGEEMFGVGRMMHTMLNEDMETLEKAPDFVIDFTENGGATSMFNALNRDPRLAHYLEKHGAMLPCSDSVKQLGPAAFYLQAQAINLMMKYAVENNKTICIKWGNGQILTRGGGNAHIPGRLKAQAVQWHLNGRALNPDNDDDIKILANVMFSSNTEQGRAADFMSPNAERISRNQLKMIGEMLGRSLELMGKVEKGIYIAQVAKFSSGARRVFGDIAKNVMMRGYENMRDAVDANGNRLYDTVARKVSNMKTAGDANQASRPDSKAAEVTEATSDAAQEAQTAGKPLYDLRAIGTTIAISHMRTYHDGWFSLGAGLQAVHDARLNGEIGDGDLGVFLEDPLWANIVKSGLRTASMSDMSHAFKKLDAGDWSHKKAMAIGKSVKIYPSDDPKNKPPLFTFDESSDATPEQAYIAKLYYDQALFITYTEKLAQMNLEGTPLPKTLEDIEQAAQLHLESMDDKVGRFQIGAYTNALFPLVDQNINGNRNKALASHILCDIAEECHGELTQEQRYAITGAQRSTQAWNNADVFMDQDSYGSKPFPALLDSRIEHIQSLDPAYHEQAPGNDYS